MASPALRDRPGRNCCAIYRSCRSVTKATAPHTTCLQSPPKPSFLITANTAHIPTPCENIAKTTSDWVTLGHRNHGWTKRSQIFPGRLRQTTGAVPAPVQSAQVASVPEPLSIWELPQGSSPARGREPHPHPPPSPAGGEACSLPALDGTKEISKWVCVPLKPTRGLRGRVGGCWGLGRGDKGAAGFPETISLIKYLPASN